MVSQIAFRKNLPVLNIQQGVGICQFCTLDLPSNIKKSTKISQHGDEIRQKTEDVSIFFTLFNEILEKVTGKNGYRFNPRCFVCDEGGANFTGLKEVYGEEFVKDRVYGCQWHFKNDVQNKSAKISDPALKQKFIDTCNKLCEVTTVSKYNILKSMLDEMAKLYPDLKPWIAWWHSRHSHIFVPFRSEGLPKVNFSEIGNAG